MTQPYRHTPRILIVDDNPSIHRDFELVLLDSERNADLEAEERRMYGRAAPPPLAKPACIVDHALSGLEGVEQARQALAEERPYQVAFVDIRMPGIDGVETISRMWQIDPAIQVVICTAYADYSWEDLIRRLGPTDKLLLLKKPFDNIEVTLLAGTLAEKWFLGQQAALKLEQMELLVAQRTQKVLALQRRESPAVPAEPLPAMAPDEPAAGPEPPLVLLIEDNPAVCRMVSQGLAAEYRIIEAKDEQQGLAQARETVPDLILMEITMPRLDGLALCRRLKRDELTGHIPVILLAADDLEATQIQALEAGADDCLVKPFRLPVLAARADNLLRSRRALQQHFNQANALQPRDIATNQVDAQFLRRTIDTIEKHASDFEFDVEALARMLGMSRRQLFRKLKAITDGTPNTLIRTLRLKRAAQLLQQSQMTVTEITYAVGFSDLKHFRTVFKEQFGVLPGEYARTASTQPTG